MRFILWHVITGLLLVLDPVDRAGLLERIAELVVIVSLFAAGLKLRTPLGDRRWVVPVVLAFGSMTLTVLAISVIGVFTPFWRTASPSRP